MPRRGHREGCQCAVCRRMGTKAVSIISTSEVSQEVAVGTLKSGEMFEYEGKTYRKDTQPNSRLMIATPVYKAHYTDIYTPLEEHKEFNPETLVIPKK